ncbi:T9SS type A sorting domain-containing protein [Gelidibacter maritimus]|uniref:T9SS type A sorting domain-containing protein n=1 Tax=Gelidibacter maritimus TaxID=2761487 RepID=A0A7W2M616_9FLAO|nr:T9SS type A sorting domain-containing protein [Gelidibacter maritimus]MBA6153354.1 T9SS type A sorting domain-containing protein [Gelidibacter maritimus]
MKQNYFLLLLLTNAFLFGQTPGSESPVMTVDATIPYQGYDEPSPLLGSAQYKIYYDNVDGVLDKPIFLIDGFDPNDSRDIPAVYALLNYGNTGLNLGDLVRDEGYDLVVLNLEASYASPTDGTMLMGGADYIQRNAFTFIELINTINSMKVGAEQNVVIGPSMGGLISRYALRYMEQNMMDHDTRLHISFDAPHRGSNVPIGMQYLFNYLVNGTPNITEAEPLVNGLLNSPAAKQMLIDHYLGHVGANGVNQDNSVHTPKGAPNFRDAFQNELDAMGFPQNTRNVAITNGSGVGQMTGTPGMELINHTFDMGTIEVGGVSVYSQINTVVNFAPAANETSEVSNFIGQIRLFSFLPWTTVLEFDASAQSTASSDGLDSAPGGQFDLYAFDDGSNPLIADFFNNLNSQYFSFIPTLSGLAIDNQPNWYANPDLSNSPFANTYLPTDNEPHMTLTPGNAMFAMDEILQGTLGTMDYLKAHTIKLQKNPVHNSMTLLSSTDFTEAKISIVDLTGKLVLNTQTSLSKSTTIPINLETGLYLVNIQTENGFVYNTKLMVK